MNAVKSFAALSALALVALAGANASSSSGQTGSGTDRFASLPASIQLTGVVRDFRARDQQGGHADFQRAPTAGFGHYVMMVADQLDSEGLPAFRSTGFRLNTNWRDAQQRNIINPKSYIDSRSTDLAGAMSQSQGGALTTAENFGQWFRDVPGVNVSTPVAITLVRQPGTNRYVFDDRNDAAYSAQGGFFPVNGMGYGNYGSTGRNFHFTYMIDTQFTFERGAGHVFTFRGDDDVWVFIDGKLVIDLGGVHGAIAQTIELDRLNWLQNGQTYSLKFFFAERHTTQSNFRIETTLNLRNVQPPATDALGD